MILIRHDLMAQGSLPLYCAHRPPLAASDYIGAFKQCKSDAKWIIAYFHVSGYLVFVKVRGAQPTWLKISAIDLKQDKISARLPYFSIMS